MRLAELMEQEETLQAELNVLEKYPPGMTFGEALLEEETGMEAAEASFREALGNGREEGGASS